MRNREIGLSIGPLCEELIFDDISANLISQLSVIVMVNVLVHLGATPISIRRVGDSPYRRHVKLVTPRIIDTGVGDSPYR
jgi:hypothetical protein